jgi:paraquat-inducible protein B
MNATGVKVDTQSLVSIMIGGIAFDLQEYAQPSEAAKEETQFQLYPDRDSSKQESYGLKSYFLMYFDESVRGLSPGAPVEIKGIKIGEVVRIELLYDLRKYDFRIPVLVMIEPERMNALVTADGKVLRGDKMEETIGGTMTESHGIMRPQRLVDKGMRAQLKTGNLLTGQLYIDLDFHEKVEPEKLRIDNGYMVFPTVPQPFERILQRVENILGQFEKVKFGDLGSDMQSTMEEVQLLLASIRTITDDLGKKTLPQVNTETLPRLNAAINDLRQTLDGIDQTIGADSALNYNVDRLSEEFILTIRSLRSLVDYLERDPQSLILGKEGEKK